SILFIWFYGNLVLQKTSLPDMILIYLVLWQSGFTENLLTRYNPIYFSSVKVGSNLDLSSAETT
ncbi:MAG: hypothetical protein ACK552_19810, partial [Microcystis sp.]